MFWFEVYFRPLEIDYSNRIKEQKLGDVAQYAGGFVSCLFSYRCSFLSLFSLTVCLPPLPHHLKPEHQGWLKGCRAPQTVLSSGTINREGNRDPG